MTQHTTALVLSGGGARGAFQMGALRYLMEERGYEWDLIAGVSVGALNGTMLAQRKYDTLLEIWNTISNDKVYTGSFTTIRALFRILFGQPSVLGNEPLRQMIDEHLTSLDDLVIPLQVGAVSLVTGNYTAFSKEDFTLEEFKRAIIASTAMPIVWSPVDVKAGNDDYTAMIDGGVRNVSPLGDVIGRGADKIVIINCAPGDKVRYTEQTPRTIVDIAKRSLVEIAVNEIFISDLNEFLRINDLVRQAEEEGFQLKRPDGEPFKYFESIVIQPDKPLPDTIDFSPESTQQSLEIGYHKAKQVLESPTPQDVPEKPRR